MATIDSPCSNASESPRQCRQVLRVDFQQRQICRAVKCMHGLHGNHASIGESDLNHSALGNGVQTGRNDSVGIDHESRA